MKTIVLANRGLRGYAEHNGRVMEFRVTEGFRWLFKESDGHISGIVFGRYVNDEPARFKISGCRRCGRACSRFAVVEM